MSNVQLQWQDKQQLLTFRESATFWVFKSEKWRFIDCPNGCRSSLLVQCSNAVWFFVRRLLNINIWSPSGLSPLSKQYHFILRFSRVNPGGDRFLFRLGHTCALKFLNFVRLKQTDVCQESEIIFGGVWPHVYSSFPKGLPPLYSVLIGCFSWLEKKQKTEHILTDPNVTFVWEMYREVCHIFF